MLGFVTFPPEALLWSPLPKVKLSCVARFFGRPCARTVVRVHFLSFGLREISRFPPLD